MSDLRSDMQNRETYLADGVYAKLDGGMIKLRADGEGRSNVIWLEPETLTALVKFARQFDGFTSDASPRQRNFID